MKKNLFLAAWHLLKKGIVKTFSDALKLAWKKIQIVKSLKAGVFSFKYKKVDGSIRDAKGTLCNEYFVYESKGSESAINYGIVKYYDLDAQAFRSFKIENYI